jgi:hypothetical protein
MDRPVVWVVGEAREAFLPALGWLAEHATTASAFAEGSDFPGSGLKGTPRAILFLQSRPGEVSQEVVERLHRAQPLARLVVLVGVFGEGEPRSGRVVQGAARVYWHQWRERLPRELGLLGGAPRRARTASETDELLRAVGPHLRTSSPGLAAICTDRREAFEALAELCQLAGFRAAWLWPEAPAVVAGADVLVVDEGAVRHNLRGVACRSQSPGATATLGALPTIVLASFPRPEDYPSAAHVRVLARPFLIADFLAALHDVVAVPCAEAADSSAA